MDQLVLVGKTTVGRGPADTGLAGHIFHGGAAQAEFHKQGQTRIEDFLVGLVAFRHLQVFQQGFRRGRVT